MDLARQEQYQSNNNNNNQSDGSPSVGGLLRFRSAPSSFFSVNSNNNHHHLNLESDNRFMDDDEHDDLSFPDFEDSKPSLLLLQPSLTPNSSSPASAAFPTHLTPPPQQQQQHQQQQQQHRSELPPQYPRNPSNRSSSSSSSGLARQSSSPAGFFSTFNNGYASPSVGGMGNFRMGGGAAGEVSSGLLTDQSGFHSRMQSSSLGLLSRISEVGDEGMDGGHSPTSSSSQVKLNSGDAPFFRSAYPVDSWDDSSQFLENNGKLLPNSQIDQGSLRPRPLSHHLSLPKTSTELSTMEKLMQFPDSVPCKIRAKRGCATHPRSIAERVRRTRISERMRKLQELVPNMDKQTNTSDMLDLAVDHIKDLQRQFKILSEKRANCKCASQLLIRQQPY